jgi:hypothetical protein
MPLITINLLTKKQVVYADFLLKVVIGNIPFYHSKTCTNISIPRRRYGFIIKDFGETYIQGF